MKQLLEMFVTFFKIGAFTFGGGWAMLPIMEREFVINKKWITKDEYVDIVAVSQSFPGVLAVNTSTFIGKKMFGMTGAFMAVLGVCLPSFMIILLIAHYFSAFRSNYYVSLAMQGINAAVPALILVATRSLLKSVKRTPYNLAVGIIATLILIVPKLRDILGLSFPFPAIHPVTVIVTAALLGIFHYRSGGHK
ncbi:MAG: chromate transporter [Clostridiaceae bacterium]